MPLPSRPIWKTAAYLFVTTDLTVSTPNLDALLAEYGMTRQEGLRD